MRRFIAIWLAATFSVALCFTLSFFASADGTSIVTTYWHPRSSHNGANGELQAYSVQNGFYKTNSFAKEWEYYATYVNCSGFSEGSFIDFKFSVVCLLPEVNSGWADYQSSGVKVVTTSDKISVHAYASRIFEYPYDVNLPENTYTTAKIITFYFSVEVLDDTAAFENISFSSPFVMYGNGKDCQILIFDCQIYASHQEYLSEVLDNILDQVELINQGVQLIQPDVASLYSVVSSLYDQVSYPNYSYYSLSYDSDGIGTGVLLNGNWFNALNSGLRSIGNYLQHHVEIENMAMQTGAMDALDLAMDDADFGALGDFGSIGNIGSWSGSSVGSAGNEGLIEWFSQTTANNLDQVTRQRSNEDFVSYYYSHISDILNYGGEGND